MTLLRPSPCVRPQRGFTLLELQMALLIISLLIMVALPMYQDFRTRAKVSEGFAFASLARSSIVEYHQITGRFPTSNSEAALPPANTQQGNYLSSMEIVSTPREGSIMLTFDSSRIPALGSNNILIIAPVLNDRLISWDCTFGNLDDEFRPHLCRAP